MSDRWLDACRVFPRLHSECLPKVGPAPSAPGPSDPAPGKEKVGTVTPAASGAGSRNRWAPPHPLARFLLGHLPWGRLLPCPPQECVRGKATRRPVLEADPAAHQDLRRPQPDSRWARPTRNLRLKPPGRAAPESLTHGSRAPG